MPTRLIELTENLPASRILLVGDFMIDKYVFGSAERISPEAPIPVLRFQREEHRLGGAGFVLAGLAALGAKVTPVGVAGEDPTADEMIQRLREAAGNAGGDVAAGLIRAPGRPTVTKIRLLGSSHDRTPQQMIRLDIEDAAAVPPEVERKLIDAALTAMGGGGERPGVDAVVLEDYNKGVLTPAVCRAIIAAARERGLPVIVDPANIADYSKYRGATALKLNRPEAERSTGLAVRNEEGVRAACAKLLAELDLEAVVVTLNEQGAFLATRGGDANVGPDAACEARLLPTRARQVADATGAGDMVLAALTTARLAGATWPEAVAIGNIAGGLEVERLGCVPITPDEIVHDLLVEQQGQAGKVRSLDSLLPELTRHRAAGRTVVFTNGCFDIVHLGHVKYFQFAKAQGDLLVVGVNTDASIRRLKGEKRPVINEEDRVGVLEELESIDYLVRFDDDTPMRLIEQIRPDVLVKGADYQKEEVVGWELVEAAGGRVALAPLIDGRSTSSVIRRILEAYSG